MAEYIKKEDLLIYLEDAKAGISTPSWRWVLAELIKRCEEFPAADVVEVVHGEWLGTEVAYAWKCSACGGIMSLRANYCCYCGAKMDGERKDGAG